MKETVKVKYSFSEQVKLALVLVTSCLTLVFTDWLWLWDQNFYDIQIRASSKPAPDDVVIVAIDETSLHEVGRWPWPRKTHAALIDRLNDLGAKTIVLDVIISEYDRSDSAGDEALADSISRKKNVVLPILAEQTRMDSQLKETLPLPILIEAGAVLGHVHIELDPDGIARSTYLYEGLGEPRWPHISLAALNLNVGQNIVLLDKMDRENTSLFTWHRAEHHLIPFLGPPGQFRRLSYSDVLNGLVEKNAIAGKTIFVGVTATGLGDALPTPVSGLTHPMPGIEINANIFTALRNNVNNEVMPKSWRAVISVIFVLLPVLFFPRLSPRSALLLSVGAAICIALIGFLLLYVWHLWFAPLAAIITVLLSYPLWSWRRLEFTSRYLDNQIRTLSDEPGLPSRTQNDPQSTLAFICEILSCEDWVVLDNHGQHIFGSRKLVLNEHRKLKINRWTQLEDVYWLRLKIAGSFQYFGLKMRENHQLSSHHVQILNNYRKNLVSKQLGPKKDTLEIIEHQILQVQDATERLRALRRFVSASLDQMADAVIVSSAFGDIVLFNQRAEYLFGKQSLETESVIQLLSKCGYGESRNWQEEVGVVISKFTTVHIQATYQDNMDLLVQIAPLTNFEREFNGLIISFSDITSIKEAERKRGEYINFLSHDLRSPLSSSLALIELLKSGVGKAQSENVERLKHYVERALSFTEDFVQIARADNLDQINFAEFDLLDVFYNAADQLWELANEKGIIIETRSALQNAACYGDALLVERAIMNVLSNAIKYSPKNTTVELSFSQENGQYLCVIKDQGFGIAEEEIPHLFTRFHRSSQNNALDIPGIGLGLAFVKTVIDGHNGAINVESEVNNGSTFTISFPVSNEFKGKPI